MASTLSDTASALPADYAARRRDLLASVGGPGPASRRGLAALTDAWLRQVYAGALADLGGPPGRTALVAVGGFGRGELAPGSDLDLVLLHSERDRVAAFADKLWYPVWDSGVHLDHAVRTFEEARRLAGGDIAVLLGLLDARHVAGDPAVAGALRSSVLADWRATARRRLPELRELWHERGRRHGDLRHSLEPDLKEGRGGLRDMVSLRAVAASWLADRPHRDVDEAVRRLADVRDGLHLQTGRGGNRLIMQEQDEVAARLGLTDADQLLREVGTAAAAVTHAAEVTWRRALPATRPLRSRVITGRRPVLKLLGPGLAEHDGEAVLTAQADPSADPLLVLRLAARAARAALPLSPSSVDRLAAESPALPRPWPAAARDLFVDLLGAGAPLVPVWEALDQAGLVERILPEWASVRHLPQRNVVHVWSVDRHLVEAAVQAAPLVRDVARPDLLLLGALLHDIGKGAHGDHSEAGAPCAAAVGTRMGLPPEDVAVVELLVRHHLLLAETATRRDLDDPRTIDRVARIVGDVGTLDLLRTLTLADARATGPAAWSTWKANLVDDLVRRVASHLSGSLLPAPTPLTTEQRGLVSGGQLAVLAQPDESGTWTVTVAAPDRPGLFGTIAGVLALHRLSVHAAQVRTEDDMALDLWTVLPAEGHEPGADALRRDIARALAGELDVTKRLARRDASRFRPGVSPPAPRVDVVAGASDTASVLEVRAHDRPELLHRLGRALALMGVSIRAARVATLGAEVVDVFYLEDGSGGRLDDGATREAIRLLTDAAG